MQRLHRAARELGITRSNLSSRRVRYILSVVLAATMLPAGTAVAAGTLTSASVALSNPQPGVTASYTFTGSSVDTSSAILCVKVVWSTTASGTTAPAGFSGASGSVTAASSTLIGSSATNWSLAKSDGTSSSGQNNIYEYTNSSTGFTPTSASGRTFVLSSITNPTTTDTAWYFHINTYGNTDCATSPIDNATVEFINTNGSLLSATIDQTLSFSITGVATGQSCAGTSAVQTTTSTTLPFGSVTPASNAVVCQDLQAATNASNGYTIYARYTAAPSNGLQSIADLTPGTNASPSSFSAAGTEAYGYTTNDQTLGTGTANRFFNGTTYSWAAMTTANAEVAYEGSGVANTTYRVSHQVGVSTTTHPGTYTTTIIYTCTPVY